MAAATGLLSAGHVIEGGVPAATVELHRNVAIAGVALLLFSAVAAMLGNRRGLEALARTAEIVALLAAAVVGAAAHLGGDMLHHGMGPWSAKPHSHGTADPHGHGGAEPDDGHDHGAASDGGLDADEHAGMVMAIDPPPGDGAAASSSALDATTPAPVSVSAQPPAPVDGHAHRHAAPAPPAARSAAPTTAPPRPPPPAPAMSGMPPRHQM